MPISFDTTGFEQQDQVTWLHPATGDRLTLNHYDGAPEFPASLEDLPRLRHGLAVKHSEVGCLIEAQVLQLGGLPALLQIVKLAHTDWSGQTFGVSVTVPRAASRVVLSFVATERGTIGVREGVLAAEVGYERWVQPHPYAPELQGKLPFHAGDDPRYDGRFPDHPLSRARAWVHRLVRTARVDPQFAALPPFRPEPPAPKLTRAFPGIPIAGHIALQIGERTTYWRMPDDELMHRLGLGIAERVQLTDTRSRDVLLVDEETGEVVIPARYFGGRSTSTRLVRVPPEEAMAAVTNDTCTDAFMWVGRMVGRGIERREYLTVEPIEHQGEEQEPRCLLSVQVAEGQEYVIAQAAPAPQRPPFEGSAVISAPSSPESIEKLGVLAMCAMNEWGTHPLRLAITFNHRPVPPPVPVPQASPEDMFNANLITAVCGVPIANHIVLQIGERTTYWKMLDGVLHSRLGQGDMGRCPLSEGRFRDLILIDESTGQALIMDRYTTNGASLGVDTRLQPVTKEEAYAAVHHEAGEEAYRWVGRLIDVAASRSEYLTLEPIVHQGERVDPFVMMAIQERDGEVIVLASCSPTPSAETPFRGGHGLNAPVSPEAIESTGVMAMYAMAEWDPHPLEMAITFTRYPNV